MEERLQRLSLKAEQYGFDGLVLVPGPNMLYSTGLGFHTSERPVVLVLPVDAEPGIILPELEAGKARAAGFRAFPYTDEEGYTLAFHEACVALELAEARLGVETLRMRLLESRVLERYAPGVRLEPADHLFASLRMRKSADELAAMRRAIDVAQEAFLRWVSQLNLGMSEREAAAALVSELLAGGADELAFGPIVASGPNGALPHAVPGSRPFMRGDWVVVDWGAAVDGYDSDLTRMVVFGEPKGVLLDAWEIVLAANEAGRMAVAPGVTCESVDSAARAVIEEAGFGESFFHRTGHGLGMEAHEAPYIVQGNEFVLDAGMTFTVEPGIYLENLGGIRIEDDVVVTDTGMETLTTLDREPFVISD